MRDGWIRPLREYIVLHHRRITARELLTTKAKPSPPALGGGGTAKRWEVLVSSFINQLNRTFHHSAVLCRKIKFWARLKVNCNIKLDKRWSPFLPQAAGRLGFALSIILKNNCKRTNHLCPADAIYFVRYILRMRYVSLCETRIGPSTIASDGPPSSRKRQDGWLRVTFTEEKQ